MSIEKVRAYLKNMNCPKEVIEFEQSSATVELAAQAAGVIPARITKTLCLMSKNGPIVICVAGDTKIDNRKFKDTFGLKAKMLSPEETLEATGHAVGGVCPFALPEGTKAYADISMKRFDTVFPAAGSSNSAIELTCDELAKLMELRVKMQIPGKHPGCKKCPNLGTENCKCRQNVVDASAASPDGDLVSAITAKVLAELKK